MIVNFVNGKEIMKFKAKHKTLEDGQCLSSISSYFKDADVYNVSIIGHDHKISVGNRDFTSNKLASNLNLSKVFDGKKLFSWKCVFISISNFIRCLWTCR